MQEQIFPSRLVEQRRLKGISQKQAAQELGVSQALLSHYENGIRECGLDFLVRAADFYGVSCDYLLGHSSNSLLFEFAPHFNNIPEDREMSLNTIVRAALSMSGALTQDPVMRDFLEKNLGTAVYLMAAGGVWRGLLPESWLGTNSDNRKQCRFLIESVADQLVEIEPSGRSPEEQHCPDSVATVSAWANDCLNESIASLL